MHKQSSTKNGIVKRRKLSKEELIQLLSPMDNERYRSIISFFMNSPTLSKNLNYISSALFSNGLIVDVDPSLSMFFEKNEKTDQEITLLLKPKGQHILRMIELFGIAVWKECLDENDQKTIIIPSLGSGRFLWCRHPDTDELIVRWAPDNTTNMLFNMSSNQFDFDEDMHVHVVYEPVINGDGRCLFASPVSMLITEYNFLQFVKRQYQISLALAAQPTILSQRRLPPLEHQQYENYNDFLATSALGQEFAKSKFYDDRQHLMNMFGANVEQVDAFLNSCRDNTLDSGLHDGRRHDPDLCMDDDNVRQRMLAHDIQMSVEAKAMFNVDYKKGTFAPLVAPVFAPYPAINAQFIELKRMFDQIVGSTISFSEYDKSNRAGAVVEGMSMQKTTLNSRICEMQHIVERILTEMYISLYKDMHYYVAGKAIEKAREQELDIEADIEVLSRVNIRLSPLVVLPNDIQSKFWDLIVQGNEPPEYIRIFVRNITGVDIRNFFLQYGQKKDVSGDLRSEELVNDQVANIQHESGSGAQINKTTTVNDQQKDSNNKKASDAEPNNKKEGKKRKRNEKESGENSDEEKEGDEEEGSKDKKKKKTTKKKKKTDVGDEKDKNQEPAKKRQKKNTSNENK